VKGKPAEGTVRNHPPTCAISGLWVSSRDFSASHLFPIYSIPQLSGSVKFITIDDPLKTPYLHGLFVVLSVWVDFMVET
jgi:hypothetical protein